MKIYAIHINFENEMSSSMRRSFYQKYKSIQNYMIRNLFHYRQCKLTEASTPMNYDNQGFNIIIPIPFIFNSSLNITIQGLKKIKLRTKCFYQMKNIIRYTYKMATIKHIYQIIILVPS